MFGISEEYEEVMRRTLVAVAKAAGTLIRKEELKRQALTARINLPIAQSLLNEIDGLLNKMPDIESEMKKVIETALKEGRPLPTMFVAGLFNLIVESIPLAFAGVFTRILDVIKEVNSLIEATNGIIKNLAKEGISIPTLSLVEIKRNDLISLFLALKVCKQRLTTIISFLQELEKHGDP
ncbi:MAG TPA: hypothetical protein VNL13_05620 [Sulfolobales archaeon]|nr:hypothetical protein [Sulfolobales archaeon]